MRDWAWSPVKGHPAGQRGHLRQAGRGQTVRFAAHGRQARITQGRHPAVAKAEVDPVEPDLRHPARSLAVAARGEASQGLPTTARLADGQDPGKLMRGWTQEFPPCLVRYRCQMCSSQSSALPPYGPSGSRQPFIMRAWYNGWVDTSMQPARCMGWTGENLQASSPIHGIIDALGASGPPGRECGKRLRLRAHPRVRLASNANPPNQQPGFDCALLIGVMTTVRVP